MAASEKKVDYFLKIVYEGYVNNRDYLEEYFYRKCKEAEKEHYYPDEFFKRCLDVIGKFEEHINKQYFSYKESLEKLKFEASNNLLKFTDSYSGEWIEGDELKARNKERYDFAENALKNLKREQFNTSWNEVSGREIWGKLYFDSFFEIKEACLMAKNKVAIEKATSVNFMNGETETPNIGQNKQDKKSDYSDALKGKVSYKWLGQPDEQEQLFTDLQSYFSIKATFKQFKPIFLGVPLEEVEPIRWHEDNASELLFFIMDMMEKGLINDEIKRMDYKKLQGCFIKPDGNIFNSSFKNLKKNLDVNLSDAKKQAISKILEKYL